MRPLLSERILFMAGEFQRSLVAAARAEARVECTSPSGALVELDGSASSDPDSEGGPAGDIVAYEWFETLGSPTPTLLGSGATIQALLPIGAHQIGVRVTDRRGAADADVIAVTVADCAPIAPAPVRARSTRPRTWPPTGRVSSRPLPARPSSRTISTGRRSRSC
jgi:hypothetical protein